MNRRVILFPRAFVFFTCVLVLPPAMLTGCRGTGLADDYGRYAGPDFPPTDLGPGHAGAIPWPPGQFRGGPGTMPEGPRPYIHDPSVGQTPGRPSPTDSDQFLGRSCGIVAPQQWKGSGIAKQYLTTDLRGMDCDRTRFCELARRLEHASPGENYHRAIDLGTNAVRIGRNGECAQAVDLLQTAIASLDSLPGTAAATPRSMPANLADYSPPSQYSPAMDAVAPPSAAGSTSVRQVSITSAEARVTPVVPSDTETLANAVNANFDSQIMTSNNGVIALTHAHAVLIEEAPWLDFQSRPNPQFGATHSGLARIQMPGLSRDALDSDQRKVMGLLAKAGVGIARDFYTYDALRFVVQGESGSYDFSWFDFTVATAKELGIEVIGRITLHKNPSETGMPRDWGAYTDYVTAVLKRYAGRVNYWQPIKEPEPGPRNRPVDDAGLTPEDVAKILGEFKRIASQVAPNARIYFPGFGPLGLKSPEDTQRYLKAMLSGQNASMPPIDVFGVDGYIHGANAIIRDRRSQMRRLTSSEIPIWMAQTGAPSAPPLHGIRFRGGGTEAAQCDFLAKSFAESFHAGATKVFWGEFLDKSQLAQRGQRSDPFDSTGLVEVGTWRLKPAYFTYRLLAAALYGFRNVEKTAPGIYTFTFDTRGPVHLVLRDGN